MNAKKKILFLVTQSEFGGAQRFIYRFVPGLDLAKYDILVGAGPEGDDEKGLLSALEKKGIRAKHLKYLRRAINPFFDFLGLIEIIKIIKNFKPDIVFVNSSKAGVLGGLASRLMKIKRIIYRIGGWTFNDPWPEWKKKLYISIEKYTAKLKDVIVNNADSDRKQAIELGIKPKEEIILIHNGVDVFQLDKEFLSKEEARRELNFKSDDFVIGTIGSLYPTKGSKYLVEAANIIKEKSIRFVLIGEGGERKKIEELIKNHNLIEKFTLIKPTYKDYKYLKAFDIFVLPSVKEGFPWTIIEAMTGKLPVIVTRVGAVPEIIENNKDGVIIEPGNSEELAKAILRLIEDKNLREKLAIEARKTVEKKFTLEKMIKEFERLF